jgi:uncharacterized protein (UPF0335 family)
MANVSNTDDVIDSRDVIERIEELEDERQELVGAVHGAKDDLKDAQDDTSVLQTDAVEESELFQKIGDAESALINWDEENGDELTALSFLPYDLVVAKREGAVIFRGVRCSGSALERYLQTGNLGMPNHQEE